MSNVSHVKEYSIKSSDEFFFDTNILIYLFATIADVGKKYQEHYAKFFSYILERKRPIHINSLVLSEFINAWLRKEYDIWKENLTDSAANEYKRHFVGSAKYNQVIETIQQVVTSKILSVFTKNNDDFNASAVQIERILASMRFRDFNDSYYLDLAERKKLIIVTHDMDLLGKTSGTVSILTARSST